MTRCRWMNSGRSSNVWIGSASTPVRSCTERYRPESEGHRIARRTAIATIQSSSADPDILVLVDAAMRGAGEWTAQFSQIIEAQIDSH